MQETINVGFLLAGNASDLASEMQLVLEPGNPFAQHQAPLQAGRKLQATGRSQDAALAFEAAARVSTCATSTVVRLYPSIVGASASYTVCSQKCNNPSLSCCAHLFCRVTNAVSSC